MALENTTLWHMYELAKAAGRLIARKGCSVEAEGAFLPAHALHFCRLQLLHVSCAPGVAGNMCGFLVALCSKQIFHPEHA